MNTPPFYQRLFHWIRPRSVLVGFVLTLLLLSLAGRIVAHHNIYSKFQRFHPMIDAQTLFYPTASQLRELVKAKLHPRKHGKIAVIVGGSSVLNGVGQTPQELWTGKLQELLGNQYRVVNLAFRGGAAQEGGAIAAQSLLEEGYNVIYVADALPGIFGKPDGVGVYTYMFWDALYKGLLPANQPRDAYIEQTPPAPALELKVRSWLDSLFYFNDLWTAIGYRWLFTVWTSTIGGATPAAPWILPRIQYDDPDRQYQPPPVAQRYPASINEREMTTLRSLCSRSFRQAGASWEPIPDVWQLFKQQAEVAFPASLRKNTLMIIDHRSPYYVQQLSAAEQVCLQRSLETTVQALEQLEYHAIAIGDSFTAEDFNDWVHLVASGGVKLAESVAPQVRAIAQKAGYLATESPPAPS